MRRILGAAVCAVVLLVTGLPVTAVSQTLEKGPCLDLEPETFEGRTDSPVYLVATIRRGIDGSEACSGKIPEKGRDRLISFEVTGANDPEVAGIASDTPESPDATCLIRTSSFVEARCVIALWGANEGLQTVRAWIDDDRESPPRGVVEADRTEGADKSAEPGNGCVGGGSPTPAGGEPDCTDVVEIEWADRAPCEPAREPSGAEARIAVFRRGGDVESGIYTIDRHGGPPKKVGAPEDLRDFLWSPDRSKLALTTGYMNSLELSVTDTRGSGRVELTDDFMLDEGAAWSPDSRRIVFASHNYRRSDSVPNLKVVSVRGGRARWITRGDFTSTAPDWSPDGKRIVYARYDFAPTRSGIVTVAPDGSRRQALVWGKSFVEFPQFSPDGTKVLYRKYLEREDARDLFVVDMKGRSRRLTRTGTVVSDFHWSPDGRRIVYETESLTGWSELRVMNADGSGDRRIARHFGLYTTFSPSWSPDSSLVAYQLAHLPYDPNGADHRSDVWVATTDGSCAQAITPTPEVTEVGPAWITPAATSNPYEF